MKKQLHSSESIHNNRSNVGRKNIPLMLLWSGYIYFCFYSKSIIKKSNQFQQKVIILREKGNEANHLSNNHFEGRRFIHCL